MSEEQEEQEETAQVERIEGTRFLGAEFLVWLWFKSELLEGTFKRPDGTALELWLDTQLTLQSPTDTTEKIQLKGIAPSASPEAKLALSRNKLPQSARISMTTEGKDFAFGFEASDFSFTSVRLPALLKEGDDDPLFERMALLEELQAVWLEQYAEFLTLRTSELWDKEFLPAVLKWLNGEETLSARSYKGLLQRAT